MVDISMEILASSVAIRNGYMPRYRVKTWRAHIDVPPDVTFIKLPRLPMIQPFLSMTGKDTTIFVETWQDHKNAIVGSGGGDAGIPVNKTMFLGITTCSVDEQLKTPALNPSVQWLDVHDPIEDNSRGKLLIKIDAKFVLPEEARNQINSPSRSENLHSRHGSSHEESPVKMIQSPRRTLAPNFQYVDSNNSSFIHHMNHISTGKSDTSVFSMRSSSSIRSQEQGVQTDLSLPIIPDISKYTSAFNPRGSFTSAVFVEDPSISTVKKSGAKQVVSRSGSEEISLSSTLTAVPVAPSLIDPLKFAEDILRRNVSINGSNSGTPVHKRTSEPISTSSKQQAPPTVSNGSKEFRRSCLVRQHVQQQGYHGQSQSNDHERERRPYKDYDLDSLEDVIDMLNNEARNRDAALSSQFTTAISCTKAMCATDHSKPPLPRQSITTRSSISNNKDKIIGMNKLPSTEGSGSNGALKRESVSSTASSTVNQFHSQKSSSPVGGAIDTVRNDGTSSPYHHQRFKEIHFDGTQAKQQATSILMTRTTAQGTSHQPVVTRRRIAAAIFDD